MKILFITLRADYGGEPKHVDLLINNLSSEIEIFLACPEDKLYYDLWNKSKKVKDIFALPHRKFSIKKLLELNKFVKDNDIKIIYSRSKGAGISNYAKHYNHYNSDRRVSNQNNAIKIILNDIYVEIASELGLIAFILFITFLYKIYKHINNNVLTGRFSGSCLYFNAISSYTIIVVWFFFAFLSSQNCDNSREGKYAVC